MAPAKLMKVNYKYIFISFSLILIGSLLSSTAFAQFENEPSGNELKDLNLYPDYNAAGDDKLLIYEHEHRSTYRGTRDSIHTKSGIPSTAKNKSTETVKASSANKEDDALSFNFLYYIIQKFKISDLVDE